MRKWGIVTGIALALTVGFCWNHWKQDALRRSSLEALRRLHAALQSSSHEELLESVSLPSALRSLTASEQVEFITKALRDELSAEGLAMLKHQAAFGPLKELFPAEADGWARQAGVNPDDCVAFNFDRHGQRCEVVLACDPEPGARSPKRSLRVVRVNNVRQLAKRF